MTDPTIAQHYEEASTNRVYELVAIRPGNPDIYEMVRVDPNAGDTEERTHPSEQMIEVEGDNLYRDFALLG